MDRIFSHLILARFFSKRLENPSQSISTTVPKQKAKASKKVGLGWVVMTFLALMVFMVASRYLTLNPEVYFPEQKVVYMAHIGMLLMHIIGAMLAILIGPFQFLDGMRKGRLLKIHRWLGRTYLLSVLFGGLGGLYMAHLAHGGVIAQSGFTVLAILWLFSGFRAYKHIRNMEIEQHREWMTRNYALTFAGVTLRLWMPIFGAMGIGFTAGYIVIAWLCWMPNLIVAQWMINRNRIQQLRAPTPDQMSASSGGQETV